MELSPFARPIGLPALLAEWERTGRFKDCLAENRELPPVPSEVGSFPSSVPEPVVESLRRSGIAGLYSHQVMAIEEAAQRHVLIATPTSSGKSLAFHLPVLTALTSDPSATALYLYPTKALCRDQESALLELIDRAGLCLSASVYDGDTPGDARRAARDRARIVLSNPDMLHSGILPNHPRWASFLQGLSYVVLDELHTYRGVFGSHMAHVLHRLVRIARFHGKSPRFLCATATIGNPLEHAARLLGVAPSEIALVDHSGAPRTARRLLVYNPPIVNRELQIRGSCLKHAVEISAELIRARVPTIIFGPSRNSVEVMLKYLREKAGDVAGPESIVGYRGGYLPETRRRIERDLREGRILGVVATNALELGIDIGDLSAVVLAGYPGSIAATWQRFGRAGRRGQLSLAVLVCNSEAIDQYLARAPETLLSQDAESARIDPGNLEILIQHLKCALFEAPFELSSRGDRPATPQPPQGEPYLGVDLEETRAALEFLGSHGLTKKAEGRFYWTGEAFPANQISLRNLSYDNFVIIDLDTKTTLAELDFRAAHTMLHEQAIYQHDAEQYQVERLDYDNHKAYVKKVVPDYFTTALTYRTVSLIELERSRDLGGARLGLGEVKVLEKVTGYKKIKFFTHENAGYGEVNLPQIEKHTTAFTLTVPETTLAVLDLDRARVIAGLRGLLSALEAVATLTLMCDPRDINQCLGDGSHEGLPAARDPFARRTGTFDPTLFLFDAVAGGVGLAPKMFESASLLLERARTLIRRCPCQTGCPACIGPVDPTSEARATSLALIAAILPA